MKQKTAPPAVREKREIKGYKIAPSIYKKAMKNCDGGLPLANRIENFVTTISQQNKTK